MWSLSSCQFAIAYLALVERMLFSKYTEPVSLTPASCACTHHSASVAKLLTDAVEATGGERLGLRRLGVVVVVVVVVGPRPHSWVCLGLFSPVARKGP